MLSSSHCTRIERTMWILAHTGIDSIPQMASEALALSYWHPHERTDHLRTSKHTAKLELPQIQWSSKQDKSNVGFLAMLHDLRQRRKQVLAHVSAAVAGTHVASGYLPTCTIEEAQTFVESAWWHVVDHAIRVRLLEKAVMAPEAKHQLLALLDDTMEINSVDTQLRKTCVDSVSEWIDQIDTSWGEWIQWLELAFDVPCGSFSLLWFADVIGEHMKPFQDEMQSHCPCKTTEQQEQQLQSIAAQYPLPCEEWFCQKASLEATFEATRTILPMTAAYAQILKKEDTYDAKKASTAIMTAFKRFGKRNAYVLNRKALVCAPTAWFADNAIVTKSVIMNEQTKWYIQKRWLCEQITRLGVGLTTSIVARTDHAFDEWYQLAFIVQCSYICCWTWSMDSLTNEQVWQQWQTLLSTPRHDANDWNHVVWSLCSDEGGGEWQQMGMVSGVGRHVHQHSRESADEKKVASRQAKYALTFLIPAWKGRLQGTTARGAVLQRVMKDRVPANWLYDMQHTTCMVHSCPIGSWTLAIPTTWKITRKGDSNERQESKSTKAPGEHKQTKVRDMRNTIILQLTVLSAIVLIVIWIRFFHTRRQPWITK